MWGVERHKNDHTSGLLSHLGPIILMAPFLPQFELALALVTIFFLAFWAFNALVIPKPPILHTDVRKCHELLSTTTLAGRAGPNGRLVVAFGLENGFTTTSETIHDKFRAGIKTSLALKNTDEARTELAELISASVRDILQEHIDHCQPISLVDTVRIAVFRTVMTIFFPNIPLISHENILFLATKMNSLWYDSKSPWKIFLAKHFESHSSIIHDRDELHQKLNEVFPTLKETDAINASENPLNVLLPAFMGLFRVVLRCLLEVRFRSSAANWGEYKQLFGQFLQDPNGRWYAEENGLSVQQIVAETLRLYPPTRRIYTQQDNGVVAVDVEQLHRTGRVWGEDPLIFDPKRWKREGLDVVNTIEYIPFGGKIGKPAKISRCPSRIRGGPKLIAVIAGALLAVIGDEWCLLGIEKVEDDISGDETLRIGRDAYETLLLCPIGSLNPKPGVSH
jgi:hypothetical protein